MLAAAVSLELVFTVAEDADPGEGERRAERHSCFLSELSPCLPATLSSFSAMKFFIFVDSKHSCSEYLYVREGIAAETGFWNWSVCVGMCVCCSRGSSALCFQLHFL
jgi:hypothetical protein